MSIGYNVGGLTVDKRFELLITKVDEGKKVTVTWLGKDGKDAALRYADCHRGATVYATRPVRHGVFIVYSNQIIG